MDRVDLSFILAEKTAGTDGLPVVHVIRSKCDFYHYLCDGVDDRVSMLKGVLVAHTCHDDDDVFIHSIFIGLGVWIQESSDDVLVGRDCVTISAMFAFSVIKASLAKWLQ